MQESDEKLKEELRRELIVILEQSWDEMISPGNKTPSVIVDGDFETIVQLDGDVSRWTQFMQSITKTPQGVLYNWAWQSGLTEYQDDIGPNEFESVRLTEVREVERTVIVKDYVTVEESV